ncbi:DUF6875 domain-containing protein [Streptomyces sp. NPDC007861]|uniref:DUF6875 domain-containing protein n=1 Tax=Streptomyces sp. NPDC007861 TaxID=3154893 RepID=UPI0033DB345E
MVEAAAVVEAVAGEEEAGVVAVVEAAAVGSPRAAAARHCPEHSLPEPARTWIEDFVAAPHPQLGRPGAICPNLPFILARRQLYWGSVDYAAVGSGAMPPARTLTVLFRQALAEAARIIEESGDTYRTAVVWVIESAPPHTHRSVIEPAFQAIRSESIAAGIMVGCFHPYRRRRSRVQPELATMRSPVPMIAMRRLLRGDLDSVRDEPESRRAFDEYFTAYDRDRRSRARPPLTAEGPDDE